jgi:predicted nuclease with TOPRIM domain
MTGGIVSEAAPVAKTEKKAATPEQDGRALERLEGMIHEVSSALSALREENGHLKEMLERRGGDADGPASWERERAEIRRRVTALSERLEALLSND